MAKKETKVMEFDPRRVKPFPDQPRKRFRGIKNLARSFKQVGQTTPGIVRLLKGDPDYDVELVDGERRHMASLEAGTMFRAEIQEVKDSADQFRRSFAANFNREPHDVMETAHALRVLQDAGDTIEGIAELAGKSTAWVSQHLSLLRLDKAVQDMLHPIDDEGEGRQKPLTFSLALLLVGFDPSVQLELANKITSKEVTFAEARRIVLAAGSESGTEFAKQRKRGPKRRIDTINSVVLDATHRVGVFTDMNTSDFNKLVSGSGVDVCIETLDRLEALVDILTRFSDRLQESLPRKSHVGTARGHASSPAVRHVIGDTHAPDMDPMIAGIPAPIKVSTGKASRKV